MNYHNMKQLAEEDNGFYSVTQEFKGATYEIFNYRLCSYTDFFNDKYSPEDTLNMRGTMFRVDTPEPELVCLPLPKFFNDGENPYTMNLNYQEAADVVEKVDGSLISTFIDSEGELAVKSKASLQSWQALAAHEILRFNAGDYEYIKSLTKNWNHTINFEFCSPENRIVLYYPYSTLRPLTIRSRKTGDMLALHEMPEFPFVPAKSYKHLLDIYHNDLVEYIRQLEGIEGYVVHFPDRMVKVKTDWYVRRHHAKDNVYNLRNLAEIIFAEEVDDLIQLFEDDKDTLEHIRYYEKHFVDKFNHIYNLVDRFWKENRYLPRKDYAIKAKEYFNKDLRHGLLDRCLFGFAMSLYLGKPIEDQIKQVIVKSQPAFEEN